MSESQKKMAQRLVDILKAEAMAVIKLKWIFTEAIAIYQAEELEKAFKELKLNRNKSSGGE